MSDEEERELTPDEKWSAGYHQGRRDAAFSTRLQALEFRVNKFEEHFKTDLMPKINTMGESLQALVKDAAKAKSNWQWWWDIAARFTATVYRAAVLIMFSAIFIHNTDLGKALAPWFGKVFFP